MLTTQSLPAKTIPELIAYAKANPGKINFASGGIGTASHIFGLLFMTMAGIELVHVPYRTNYMPDLIGGQVQMVINPIPQAVEFVKTGKVRGLAVTTKERLAALPDLPTVGQFVPGYEAIGWYGIGAPKSTPGDIIEKLNAAVNAALDRADTEGAACRAWRRADEEDTGRVRAIHHRRRTTSGARSSARPTSSWIETDPATFVQRMSTEGVQRGRPSLSQSRPPFRRRAAIRTWSRPRGQAARSISPASSA